ncbi:hypothetical protein ACHAWF_007311, partial [Thalassiosira exigua]
VHATAAAARRRRRHANDSHFISQTDEPIITSTMSDPKEEPAADGSGAGGGDGRSQLMSRRSSAGSVRSLGPRLASVKIGNDCPANVTKLTSDVFGPTNPPKDWADLGLLIPHEGIRRQMTMMVQSASALPDDLSPNEAWKAELFAKWYVEYFYESVHEHHDAEEEIYFPWIKTKAEYPEKEFSKGHEELMKAMGVMKKACQTIVAKKGKGCADEIKLMKEKVPAFEKEMRAHLQEEEEIVPALLRDNFTQDEEGVVVERIIAAGGLTMARKFMPAVLEAMREWAKPGFYDAVVGSMPPPIRHLEFKYYVPDYENVVAMMRDAPTMEKRPRLKRTGCCGIPFCFPCVL